MKSRHLIIWVLLLSAGSSAYAQKEVPFSFDSLFAKYPAQFDSIIQHKEDYRLQLLYTRIDRDANNTPHLTTYSFDADKYYYYCASMMKLPACALSLEKLNNLSKYHVNMLDSLGIDTVACTDLSPESMMLGTPYSNIAQYIKEMLLVSNNNAFNPVYDFLGQYDFQERLHQIGCPSAVISNRYAGCDSSQNRRCDPVSLFDRKTHKLKYEQPCIINQRRQFYQGELSPLVGNAYLGGGGVINEPKNFRFANYIKLGDLHKLLTKVMLPETQLPAEKLNLTHSDYQYLYKCMGMFPRECAYPTFDSVHYPDNYMKYFMPIDSGSYTMPDNIRIFNKVGQAYGFMTDCSYVVDTLNKVEFFLSCAMYLNADGILNDGKYEYDQIGYPFFHNLFNAVYNEELIRHKDFTVQLQLPDFSDTLLVKVRPSWVKVDSTGSIEEMETVLCSLADSMWQDKRPHINNKELINGEIFYRNLTIALRSASSATYPFDALRQKKVSVLSSDDGHFRIFSWDKDTASLDNALIQFSDSSKHIILNDMRDFQGNKGIPNLIFTKIFQIETRIHHWETEDSFKSALYMVKVPSKTIYLLLGNSNLRSGSAEYLQAYSTGYLNKSIIEKSNVFLYDGKYYPDIMVEKTKGNETITFDVKKRTVSFPMPNKWQTKIRSKRLKLKFDGTVFK